MNRGGLRRRLAWALAATGAATALLLGLMFWLSEEAIEEVLLRRLMQSELNLLSGAVGGENRHQLFFRPARGVGPPPEWAALPPGSFVSVDYGGLPYQLLVGEIAPGDRVYLAQSLSIGHQRETWLLWALAAGVLLSGLLASALSGRLSRLALQPLQSLLERVRLLRAGQQSQRLAPVPETPELDVLIESLNDYMEQLDRMIGRERAFSGAAAHELQTPLAVISSAAELLALRLPQEPALQRIQRAGHDASQMLDMLLSLSDAREAPAAALLNLERELPLLAQQCELREGVQLIWKAQSAVLQAPAAAVALVFLNLLRNALRAATSCVEIRIEAGAVRIRDDGAGIAPELLQRIFEPGVSGSGGTGLGLHIARAVAERQGWRLQITNAAQGGALAEWRWQ